MTSRNIILMGAGVVLVVAAAYGVGRMHGTDGERRAGSDEKPSPAVTAQTPTATSNQTSPGKTDIQATTKTPHPVPANIVQFKVGNSNVKALLIDQPFIWIGTSHGVIKHRIGTDEHVRYDNKSGLLSNGVFSLNKVNGEIWVGTYGGGLSILNVATGKWRNYNIPNGMADAFVYDTLVAQNGDVWIATWSGVNRIIGGDLDNIAKWEVYTVENTNGGVPNDWIYGLEEGKNGEIWLATEGGLAQFKDGRWRHWSHKDGLGAPYEMVKTQIPFRNDPGKVSSHHARQKAEQGLAGVDIAYNPNYIVSLKVDAQGRVWAGTWGGGLSMFDGKTWKTFTYKDGLPANHVFMLEIDRADRVWIGTSRGLARYDGSQFKTFGREAGIYSDNVFSMAIAADGDAWVGSYGGVTRFLGGIN